MRVPSFEHNHLAAVAGAVMLAIGAASAVAAPVDGIAGSAPLGLMTGRDSNVSRAELQASPQALPQLPQSVKTLPKDAANLYHSAANWVRREDQVTMTTRPEERFGRQGFDPSLPELQATARALPWSG